MSLFGLDWLGFGVVGQLVVGGVAAPVAQYGARVGLLSLLLIVGW